jgi:hypothetical protein
MQGLPAHIGPMTVTFKYWIFLYLLHEQKQQK